jgi:hypothetical protein
VEGTGVIVYRRKGLLFGEAFYEPLPARIPRVDILRITMSELLSDPGARAKQSHTLVIDLRRPDQILFEEMNKVTRYEVHRAIERDTFEYTADHTCSEDEVHAFCDYYDRFAASKKRRPIFRERLKVLAREGMLVLTRSQASDGEVLVWHSYLRCLDRVVLLYSASLFRETPDAALRSLIGRANRYAHWNDMLAFAQMGCVTYDMGGIDISDKSHETSNIAIFKRGFGGSVVPVYSQTLPKSIIGRVALSVAGALGVDL